MKTLCAIFDNYLNYIDGGLDIDLMRESVCQLLTSEWEIKPPISME